MFFAKFCRFLTACCALMLLNACTSNVPPTEFDRAEAVKARINLALAYLEQRDFPKAKENIDKALAHDSRDYLPHSVLAYYYQQVNDVEHAQKSYQTALKLSENQPDVLNNYGTFLCRRGKFEQAFRYFEQALTSQARYYHQADTWENIALCARQSGQLDKFEQAKAQLGALSPERVVRLP